MSKLRKYFRETSGAAAVEFAFVSMLLILSVLFVFVVGLILYFNLELDRATSKAARQIMIGTVQKQGITQSAFITQFVCPFLPGAMSCGDVIVSVQTVTEAAGPSGYYQFVNSNATALTLPVLNQSVQPYSPGIQGSYEYVQIVYPFTFLPGQFATFLGSSATYKGSPAFVLTSTAAFKNEQY